MQDRRTVAVLLIDGRHHEIKSKEMPEWIARKQIHALIKDLRKQGKQVKLLSFKPDPIKNDFDNAATLPKSHDFPAAK